MIIEWYQNIVSEYPLITAFVQFAILGTIGELISNLMNTKCRFKDIPYSIWQWMLKILAWGLLGIIIKFAFVGFKGLTNELIIKGFLPKTFSHPSIDAEGFLIFNALAVSVFTNVFFGPQMMAFHRFTDNLIAKKFSYEGLKNSIYTLVWFWIPAHTVTFSLPKEFQIGLAALWSVALGFIMGFFKSRINKQK